MNCQQVTWASAVLGLYLLSYDHAQTGVLEAIFNFIFLLVVQNDDCDMLVAWKLVTTMPNQMYSL